MIRLLIKFILLLYVLLPGGLVHGYSLENIFSGPAQPRLFAEQADVAKFCTAELPGTRRARDKVKAIEIQEDEDPGSSRKYSEARKSRITFLAALADDSFSHYQKSQLPFCEHFSYSSSPKFIIHRVIRI